MRKNRNRMGFRRGCKGEWNGSRCGSFKDKGEVLRVRVRVRVMEREDRVKVG